MLCLKLMFVKLVELIKLKILYRVEFLNFGFLISIRQIKIYSILLYNSIYF